MRLEAFFFFFADFLSMSVISIRRPPGPMHLEAHSRWVNLLFSLN